MDIEDILNGQAPEETPVAAEPEALATPEPSPVTTEAPSPPRDEQGRFAPKGETQPEPPAAAATPAAKTEHDIPPAALIEERRKRQDLEQRVAQYEQHFAQLQQQQAQPPPQIPSVYEDESGFAQGLMQTAALQAQQQLLPQVQEMLARQQIDFQERLAQAKYPDYEEKVRTFIDMAKSNPALHQEMLRRPDPAEFAYQYAKNALEVQQIGSLDLGAIEAALRQKIEAEYAAKAPAPTPRIPTSLADAQSSRSSAGVQAPPSLNDILGRK